MISGAGQQLWTTSFLLLPPMGGWMAITLTFITVAVPVVVTTGCTSGVKFNNWSHVMDLCIAIIHFSCFLIVLVAMEK